MLAGESVLEPVKEIAMSASIVSFSRDDKATAVATALRRDGVAIVRELVAPEVMDALTERVAAELEEQEPGGGSWFGHRARTVGQLFARGPEFAEHLLLNPLMLEVADAILLPQAPMAPSATAARPTKAWDVDPDAAYADYLEMQPLDPVLGPNCHHYRVNIASANQVCGGGTHQPFHREMDIYRPFLEHDPEGPERVLAVNWAATDFTHENGATRLVPGSHRWAQKREAKDHEVAQAVMPKGSVAFWTGRALHGLGASRDEAPRTGLIFTLVVNWLTQEENQYVAVPPEVARDLPERAQSLLGYRASPSMGFVKGRNPDNILQLSDKPSAL